MISIKKEDGEKKIFYIHFWGDVYLEVTVSLTSDKEQNRVGNKLNTLSVLNTHPDTLMFLKKRIGNYSDIDNWLIIRETFNAKDVIKKQLHAF